MSHTHSRSGDSGANRRDTRSSARCASGSATVVRLTFPRTALARPRTPISRSTVQRATGIPSRFSCSHTLPRPVDGEVRLVDPGDLDLQPLVAAVAVAGRALDVLVVRGRGDLDAVFAQHAADRLDTPTQTALSL